MLEKFKNHAFLVIVVMFYLVLQIGVFAYFGSAQESEIELLVENSRQNHIDSIDIGTEKLKNEVFEETLFLFQEGKVAKTLYKVSKSRSKKEINKLRENLQKALVDDLKEFGFESIHIHLPNKESFLRVETPDLFGDSLSFRESINKILLQKKPIHGFEAGRTNNSFRYLIPVKYGDELVGSFEVCYSENKLFETINNLYPNRSYYFIIKNDAIKLLEKYRNEYIPFENTTFSIRQDQSIPNPINNFLKNLKLDFFEEKSGIIEDNKIISVLSLKDIGNNKIAYTIIVEENRALDQFSAEYWKNVLFTSLVLISLLAFAVYRELQGGKLHFEKRYLDTILNSQKDIVFVTEGEIVSDANKAFLDFFKTKTVEDFRKKYKNICDFFVSTNEKNYISKKMYGSQWIDTILNNPETEYRVIINMNSKQNTFKISATYMDFDSEHRSVISLQNITKVIETNQKLQEQVSEQNAKINENIKIIEENVIVTGTNKAGVINYVSEAFLTMTGYSRDAVIGQRHSMFKHPDTPKTLYKELWGTVSNGDVWEGEMQNLDSFGREYWMKVHIYPKKDERGKINGYVAIRQDITDKKQLEWMEKKDQLTSLGNREHFKQVFEETVKNNKEHDKPVSLVLIYMDNLREYNIAYSLQKGDSLIRSVAVILRKHATCGQNSLFRLAGGEFTVICDFEDESALRQFSERIREAVENAGYHHNANGEHKVATISVGAFFSDNLSPEHDGDQIYGEVSSLIQVSRRKGGNTVEVLIDNPD
jgi:diguanylate cyclase (GGDEF)-like protein/PAS domain S-box-containing protein